MRAWLLKTGLCAAMALGVALPPFKPRLFADDLESRRYKTLNNNIVIKNLKNYNQLNDIIFGLAI